jgi:hypothetical protein
VGREGGGKAVGFARVGAGEGWMRSDLTAPGLAAPDLRVGCDSGWKAASLARAGTEEDGGPRISPLRVSEWGATVDGRPPVLHELALEKDGSAWTSPLRISPLRVSEWGATVNGGMARDGARRSQGTTW